MRKRSGVCPVPGCPNLQPCPEHKRQSWAGSNRRGTTRAEQKKRRQILRRDPICQLCGERPSTICDHVLTVAEGAPESYLEVPDEMLRGICSVCDKKKSSKEGHLGKRRRNIPAE